LFNNAVISQPFDMTMMSHPVDCPAWSCGWSLPKKDAFSWMTSL
jgi:hypothetical protein